MQHSSEALTCCETWSYQATSSMSNWHQPHTARLTYNLAVTSKLLELAAERFWERSVEEGNQWPQCPKNYCKHMFTVLAWVHKHMLAVISHCSTLLSRRRKPRKLDIQPSA